LPPAARTGRRRRLRRASWRVRNADDLTDYRPGRRAVARDLDRQPRSWSWASARTRYAASPEPWGSGSGIVPAPRVWHPLPRTAPPVTREGLAQVAAGGRRYLHELGFRTVRVRHDGQVARIEVAPEDIERLAALRRARFEPPAARSAFPVRHAGSDGYRRGQPETKCCHGNRLPRDCFSPGISGDMFLAACSTPACPRTPCARASKHSICPRKLICV